MYLKGRNSFSNAEYGRPFGTVNKSEEKKYGKLAVNSSALSLVYANAKMYFTGLRCENGYFRTEKQRENLV